MSARARGLVVLGLLFAGTALATGVGSAADPRNSRLHGAVAAPSHTDLAYFSTDPVSPSASIKLPNLPRVARVPSVVGETELGFKLRDLSKQPSTSFVYNSVPVYAIHLSCQSTCVAVSQVQVSIKENVAGTTSKRWINTVYASTYSGSQPWTASYNYACAVNVPNTRDIYCPFYKADGADGSSSANFTSAYSINSTFGTTNLVTKLPMIKPGVRWSDGTIALGDDGQPGEKFRGWDVCATAGTTKLCATSGTGT